MLPKKLGEPRSRTGFIFLVTLFLLNWSAFCEEKSFTEDDCAAIDANSTCNCTYNAYESVVIQCSAKYETAHIRITVLDGKNVEISCQGRIGVGCNVTHPCIPAELLARLPPLGRLHEVGFLSVRYCFPFSEILKQLSLGQSDILQVHGLEFIPLLQRRHFGKDQTMLKEIDSLELLAQSLHHLHDEQSLTLVAQLPSSALPKEQQLEEDILGAFVQLRSLTIDTDFKQLPVGIFRPVARTLSELFLLGCLREFPRVALSALRNLKQLTMSGHQLESRLRADDFDTLSTLTELTLRRCGIIALPARIFHPLPVLKHLNLVGNKLRMLPATLLAQQRHLQLLDLSDNQLEALPAGLFASTTALKKLYLTYNRLRRLSAYLFPPQNALVELYVDLNELRVIEVGTFAYARHLRDLVLSHNKLDWTRAESCVVLEGVRRLEMLGLQNNSVRYLCKELGASNYTLANSLRLLDVRQNKFTHLSAQLLHALNRSETLRSIKLEQNPWACNCEAQALHAFVRSNRVRFPEVKNLKCNEPKQVPLVELAYRDFCLPDLGVNATLVFTLISVSALSLLMISVAMCYYKYKLQLKIWLYAHGACLRCISETELDRDRRYDAFISYTHQDEHFVEHELLPGLEQSTPPFKVCIHVRDWVVGAFISEQIIDSVEQSRRTIIVLSQHFIQSEWALMEFRMAHQRALNEGRTRIILVIYGELTNTDLLDQELRAYLKMNTYLKWGEPWFWEKLRYAMPHSRVGWERSERGGKERFNETPLHAAMLRA
ncbi:protein toll-like [Rhagoletis pomonella]|uniref:protein toll-like n=1 Tax=Rhagoletis pomonella TaxID=28610 RepID=UPI00177BA09C|nr:protein toll-like [Rhagoletis pomonella]